ncbi:MAG: acetyl-CoA carboxylase biotin carboxyl carrier protein subunit [Bacteroidota bacterium]
MATKIKNKKSPKSACAENIKCKYLVIGGTRYRTLLNKKFTDRKKWEYPDLSKVNSYIPGTILDIFVKEGDKVKEGDPLVILEAMKMRNRITSHISGTVAKVNVEKGERIPKGHMIIRIEALEG